MTLSRDVVDRRRVLVPAVPERVMEKVGPIYGRVAERWSAYLNTLTADQIEFATQLLTRAAEINRDEVDRLRHG
ncbi:MAG: hypothetical protein ACOH16_04520 [Propionibacteriaceae bacterium]